MSNLILYSTSEAKFDTNGLGILTDVVDDYVIQQLNGQYELEFKYPSKGAHAADIVEDAYVTAKPDPETDAQPFRVYRISNAVRGLQTIRARHIAYNLKGICVPPFSASSAPAAMLALQTKAVTDNPFTFWTDKTTVAKMQSPVPSDIWSLLGGKEGSVLDTYRGEYEFDQYTIKLWNRRGADRGVSIRYGRNLRDLQQDRNIANMFTGVYPYWADSEGNLVQLSERYISGPGTYREPKIRPLDLSQSFQTAPTEEQLRKEAERYIKTHDIGVPEVSIKVEFIQLEQTEEYKDTAILERVALGDTVSVIFPELQVDAKARVVSIKYQPTRDRYESVTIGKVKSNIAGTITEQQKEIARKPELTDMQAAIEAATSWLTNGQGYKVERRDPHTGQVIDTLYMDTPDINTAVNVLRQGQSGIGFSHSGVNGPYVSAWTIDGKFNADFITAGVLTATIIKTGILSDKKGKNYINLETGETRIKADELIICGKTPQQIAAEAAKTEADEAIKRQTQQDIFNLLTNNGTQEGLFMKNGQLYVNASYIVSGILQDRLKNMVIDLETGNISIKKGNIDLGGGQLTISDRGDFTAKSGIISGLHFNDNDLWTDDYMLTPKGIIYRTEGKEVGSILVARSIPPRSEPVGISTVLGRDGDVIAWVGKQGPVLTYHESSRGTIPARVLDLGVDLYGGGHIAHKLYIDPDQGGGADCYSGNLSWGGFTMEVRNGLIVRCY